VEKLQFNGAMVVVLQHIHCPIVLNNIFCVELMPGSTKLHPR